MRTAVLLLVAASALCGEIPLSEYRERRARLRKESPDGVFILAGNTERDVEEIRGGFFQEPNFQYLTGWMEPGAIVVITPQDDVLFIPKRNPEREKWTGRKAAPEDVDIKTITGFDIVLPAESFESQIPKFLEAAPQVYALEGHPLNGKLKALLAMRDITKAEPVLAQLRLVKSQAELAQIGQSIEATIAAFRAAWSRMAAGVFEYQIAGTMVQTWTDRGCLRNAYSPIVGSGPNATVLHYSRNSRRMDAGELLLIDAAAECGGYAADITRTVPVDRKFTPRQRELYDVVLGAERAAIAAAKPGMTIGKTTPDSLYKVVLDYLNSHGKDLHGKPLGAYLTHGVSHHVGLDVHDVHAQALPLPLSAGMVITIEPGIYIPEENTGIRIEDMLLITENGAKVLTATLPVDPDAVEKALAKPNAPPR